ncbi:MAG TPA: hypothetical protein VGI46_12520 [Candidatus Acidoferrum sp.]
MNPLTLLVAFGILLLLLLAWVLRDPRKLAKPASDLRSAEELDRSHVTYFPQVKQALAAEDLAFLASRGSRALAHTVRKERRKIALIYLVCLRADFLKLWRLARVIASMSQQVGMAQELERLQLAAVFYWRYEMIRLKFHFGFAPLPELGSLSDVVSRLSVRLETAMKDLGERAALAAKLASSPDGRRLHTS